MWELYMYTPQRWLRFYKFKTTIGYFSQLKIDPEPNIYSQSNAAAGVAHQTLPETWKLVNVVHPQWMFAWKSHHLRGSFRQPPHCLWEWSPSKKPTQTFFSIHFVSVHVLSPCAFLCCPLTLTQTRDWVQKHRQAKFAYTYFVRFYSFLNLILSCRDLIFTKER